MLEIIVNAIALKLFGTIVVPNTNVSMDVDSIANAILHTSDGVEVETPKGFVKITLDEINWAIENLGLKVEEIEEDDTDVVDQILDHILISWEENFADSLYREEYSA